MMMMDLDEYTRPLVLAETWDYQGANSIFLSGERQIVKTSNLWHIKNTLLAKFTPTGKIRDDFVALCDLLGVVPHPRLARKQLPHYEFYLTQPTLDQVKAQELEKKKESSNLPGGYLAESSIDLSSIRIDIPSLVTFLFLLQHHQHPSIEKFAFNSCQLDIEHIANLTEMAAHEQYSSSFPCEFRLDWNPSRVSQSFHRLMGDNIRNNCSSEQINSLRLAIAGVLWRKLRKALPIPAQPSAGDEPGTSGIAALFDSWDTNRDGKLYWEEFTVGVEDLRLNVFNTHLTFAVLDYSGDGIRKDDFVSILAPFEVSEALKEGPPTGGAPEETGIVIDSLLHLIEPFAVCFSRFLAPNSRIQKLYLRYSDLQLRHGQALSNALNYNGTLRLLNLRGNRLCDNACIAIGKALVNNNRTLTHLDLSENPGITTQGVVAFMECVGGVPIRDLKATQGAVKEAQNKANKAATAIQKEMGNNSKKGRPESDGLIAVCGYGSLELCPLLTLDVCEMAGRERIEEVLDVYGETLGVHFRNCALRRVSFDMCHKVTEWEPIQRRLTYGETGTSISFVGTPAAHAFYTAGGMENWTSILEREQTDDRRDEDEGDEWVILQRDGWEVEWY